MFGTADTVIASGFKLMKAGCSLYPCNGDRVWIQADEGRVFSIPMQWTSLHTPDAFELASEGRAWFRHDDLAKLVDLISDIRQLANEEVSGGEDKV